VHFSFFTLFSVSRHIPGYTVSVPHFPSFFYFPAIFHVLQFAFRNFHVFHSFSSQSRSYSVCFSFSTFFKFFAKIQVLIWVFLIFQVFHCFSPQSRSYTVFLPFHTFFKFFAKIQVLLYFSYFTFFTVSHHNPDPTVYVSHFPRLSVFLTTLPVLPCEILIFLICKFSCHIPVPTVCNFHFSSFSVFLTTIQIIHFVFAFLHVFQVFRQNPGPTLFLIFHVFHCFSSQSRSYSVFFSFCTFYSFLPHFMSCHVSFSFSSFVSFLAIYQVLQCAIFTFHVF